MRLRSLGDRGRREASMQRTRVATDAREQVSHRVAVVIVAAAAEHAAAARCFLPLTDEVKRAPS
jgi:hypothetical protein